MESLTVPYFNGVFDSNKLMESSTPPQLHHISMESLIPKIILNKMGILIPSNYRMTNFLGIPNFLIKIGVNNLQNKMNIKKNKKNASKECSFP